MARMRGQSSYVLGSPATGLFEAQEPNYELRVSNVHGLRLDRNELNANGGIDHG
jgi:hypothetical protein